MSNLMLDLISKTVVARNAIQRMMASFNFFFTPPTQGLENTLSFEFFYQRRDAFGQRSLDESCLKPEGCELGDKKH